MLRICRTCLSEITSKHYIDLKRFPFAKKQLMLCIPELDFDIILNPLICMTCAQALHAAYKYKSCCLRTEQRIHSYIQKLTIQQDNNNSTINSTEILSVNDLTNDCNAADNHFKTGLNLEDVKEEYTSDAADENCDDVEVNYESIKEEGIEIEGTELDDFIKSEALDSCDTEVSFSLEQWSQFENATNQTQNILSEDHLVDKPPNCQPILAGIDLSENISNNNKLTLNSDNAEATNSMEIDDGLDCLNLSANIKDNNMSSWGFGMKIDSQSSIGVLQSKGLLEQYTKSNYGKYIVNMGSSTSSTICAESSTKQSNGVTKAPEMVNRLESKHSLPTGTFSKLETKSHSKNDRRRPYRLHKNKKNSKEQIVGISVLHIDLLRDCKQIVTEVDGSSAGEIDINNYPNYLKSGTSDSNVNIENNKTTVTQAEAKLSNATDQPPLQPKPRNVSALLKSNKLSDVSSQHSDSFSAQVKNHKIVDTVAKKPYKCNVCDYASSQKGNLKTHFRRHTGEKSYKCNSCDYASSRQDTLKVHMAQHTAKKSLKCSCCDYTCSRRTTLKIHMGSHTGAKLYKCNSCEYASPLKGTLQTHMSSHTGEKPYKCNSCSFASSQKGNLQAHMMCHTGEKPYKCEWCDYKSSRQGNIKMHMTKRYCRKTIQM